MIGNRPRLRTFGSEIPLEELAYPIESFHFCRDQDNPICVAKCPQPLSLMIDYVRNVLDLLEIEMLDRGKWTAVHMSPQEKAKLVVVDGRPTFEIYATMCKTRPDYTEWLTKTEQIVPYRIIDLHRAKSKIEGGASIEMPIESNPPCLAVGWLGQRFNAVRNNRLSDYSFDEESGSNPIREYDLSNSAGPLVINRSSVFSSQIEPWYHSRTIPQDPMNLHSFASDPFGFGVDTGEVTLAKGSSLGYKINVSFKNHPHELIHHEVQELVKSSDSVRLTSLLSDDPSSVDLPTVAPDEPKPERVDFFLYLFLVKLCVAHYEAQPVHSSEPTVLHLHSKGSLPSLTRTEDIARTERVAITPLRL